MAHGLTHPHLIRQYDLLPPSATGTPITVVGAGAVGSFTLLALAKSGFQELAVYDDDTVDVENLNNQFYPASAVGQLKVNALGQLVRDFTGEALATYPYRYTASAPRVRGILVMAVDSMEARRVIWERNRNALGLTAVIDPRMGAEQAACYVVRPSNEEDVTLYAKTQYNDNQAVQEPCTAKATAYTSLLLAGHVVKVVKDLVTGRPHARSMTWSITDYDMVVGSTRP